MLKFSKIHILFALILILIVAFGIALVPYIEMGINNWKQRVSNSQNIPPAAYPQQTNQIVTEPTPKKAEEYDLDSEPGRFESEINHLLLAKNFAKIDEIARKLRISKKRFVNGRWALYRLYSGLGTIYAEKPGQLETDEDWKKRIALLESWKKQMPESPTARIALAYAWIWYGWFARGTGFISTVSAQNRALLNVRLGNAEAELNEARELTEKCPQWYHEKLFISLMNGTPGNEFESLFNEAVRFEPNYFPYYQIKSEKHKPKWGGRSGEWREYVESLPEILAKHNSDEGNQIYLILVVDNIKDHSVINDFSTLSKSRIKQGFADIAKKYKADDGLLNSYAYLSILTLDIPSAKEALKQIGDDPDPDVWSKETYNVMKREVESGVLSNLNR